MKTVDSNKKLKKNIFYNGAYQLLILIVPIITTPYVTRIFTPTQMGIFSASTAFVALFVILSMIGLPYFGSREISNNRDNYDETFFQLWITQGIFTVLVFAIYVFLIFIVPIGNKDIYLLQSLLILVSIFDVSWFFIGIEEIEKTIIRNLSSKVFATLLIFLLVNKPTDLYLYVIINILAMLLGNLTMIFELKNWINFKKVSFKSYLKKNFKDMSLLMVPQFINSLKTSIDRNLLQVLGNSYSVGIYDQGKKIINIMTAVTSAMTTAIMPRMSYLVSIGKNNEMIRLFEKIFFVFSGFSILFINGVFAVGEPFVAIFFGDGYQEVTVVLKICCISLIFLPINSFFYNGMLIPLKRDKIYTYISFIGAASILLLNALFDTKFLFLGASLAYVITEIILFIIASYSLKDVVNLKMLYVNMFSLIILIILNIISTSKIIENIYVSGEIFKFLVFGIISVILSCIFVAIFVLMRRIFNREHKKNTK
ncbi:oligosaccharide flippase family protein [Enterococcus avium]|uniref:oligosaccharide flippase family protein n=1 Tax=Enterococcus avium TaxID=33945 RepID=UPI003462C933